MATIAVATPPPKSPGSDVPVKTDTPPLRPPSPSAPPSMFAPQASVTPAYERRGSGESEREEQARSRSTPMTRPVSPPPKRTSSAGALPPFLASSATLSPPSFHPRNLSPESRRTRSSENLPTGVSSPESSPRQHHVNTAEAGYHNDQHLTMRPSEHTLYSGHDYDAMMRPKKRHKTSRACDECRRKKIRCDATSEANVEQCSSCKRAGVNCSFSRVPMKRGPTKGLEAQYIRELEDRLVSLEYSVQTKTHVPARDHSPPVRRHADYGVGGGTPPQIYHKPHALQNEPVKLNPVLNTLSRNHVDRLPPIEAIHSSPPHGNEKRHSADYFRQPYHPTAHRHEPLTSHSFHPSQRDLHTSDRRESVDQTQRKLSITGHPVHERPSFNDMNGRRPSNITSFEKPSLPPGSVAIDEAAINRYYELYHQTLPVLPHSLERLHGYLSTAPLHLRDALLHSIYALTSVERGPSTPPSPRSPPPPPAHIDHTIKACDIVGAEAFIPENRSQRSLSRNLLHMQILLLLAINADKRAFAAPQRDSRQTATLNPPVERAYTSRFVGSVIGAAWGCANELRLGESDGLSRKRSHEQIASPEETMNDIDGEEALCRRAWWILVILDRWRAASISSVPLISDDKIRLKDSDRTLLGEGSYHLVRLSCVLGHAAEIPSSSTLPDMQLPYAQIARLLNGELERVRETAGRTLSQDPILNVAYWHCKLLIVSHTSDMCQSHANVYHGLLSCTKKVVDLLHSRLFNVSTPLIHHIIGFVTVVLVRLTNTVDTRDEALKMLHDLLGDRKPSQFDPDKSVLVEGYDIITKKFVEHSGRRHSELPIPTQHRRESESNFSENGIGRLAHLAELAVGEGSEREYTDRQYQKQKYEVLRNIGGEEGLDGLAKRQGYLSALQTLFYQ